jgi:hypothetical protein
MSSRQPPQIEFGSLVVAFVAVSRHREMFGGLFGDLPAAKGDGSVAVEPDDASKQGATKPAPATSVSGSKRASAEDGADNKSTVLKGIGVTGTAMAFVPTSVLQRRRTNPVAIRPTGHSEASRSLPTAPVPSLKKPAEDEAATATQNSLSSRWSVQYEQKGQHSQELFSISSERATTEERQNTEFGTQQGGPLPFSTLNNMGSEQTAPYIIDSSADQSSFSQESEHVGSSKSVDHDVVHFFVDPQRMQQLLDEAQEDPYDPLIPNDLLLVREQVALQRQRESLQREAHERLIEQQRLREHLERERLQLQQAGRLDELARSFATGSADSASGRGRGGPSNLPAWLVEKQRLEGLAQSRGQ